MASPFREVRRVGGTLVGYAALAVLTFVWGLLVVPLTLGLRPLWPRVEEHFAALTHRALRAYIEHLPFLRLRVEGVAARLEGPRILVANHQSRLDSPVLLALEPRLCGPVRGYMLRVPLLGSVIRMMGFFDADAGEAAVLDAIDRAARRAGPRGGALLFYPEGTRSETGEVGTFRRGAFRAAVDHGLPIQPVVIEGLDAALPPGHAITPVYGRYLARIRYLEPLHPPYDASERESAGGGRDLAARRAAVRKLAEEVRAQLADELARMRAERTGKPADPDSGSAPLAPAGGREPAGRSRSTSR